MVVAPGLDRRGGDLAQEPQLAAGRVFGRELDVRRQRAGVPHRGADPLETGVAVDAQLVFEVQIRGRQEHVNAGPPRARERRPGPVDVPDHRAGQARHDRRPHRRGDGAHRFEIAVRRDGEARFDDVHAELLQVFGDADLLGRRHAESWCLLPVAQGRVENAYSPSVRHCVQLRIRVWGEPPNKSK